MRVACRRRPGLIMRWPRRRQIRGMEVSVSGRIFGPAWDCLDADVPRHRCLFKLMYLPLSIVCVIAVALMLWGFWTDAFAPLLGAQIRLTLASADPRRRSAAIAPFFFPRLSSSHLALRRSRASSPARAHELHAERHAALARQDGNDSAGRPVSVHSVQKAGSPVASRPFGATPGRGRRDDRVVAVENLLQSGRIAGRRWQAPRDNGSRTPSGPSSRISRSAALDASPPRSTTAAEPVRHVRRHDDTVVVPGFGIGRRAARPARSRRRAGPPDPRTPRVHRASVRSQTGVRTRQNCGGSGGFSPSTLRNAGAATGRVSGSGSS